MKDMERLCNVIEEELHKIAEKGLNTGNLDTAYKLIDMYKDLKNMEYWEQKGEYYMEVLDEMHGGYSNNEGYPLDGYSERRKRDSMGRYSRDGGLDGGSSYARHEMPYGKVYNRDRGYSGNYVDRYGSYMDSKQSYRTNKTPECKQRLMSALEEYMEEFSAQMEEMLRDSDCAEERTAIKRHLDKIKNIA